ncbi:predicted protein [Histoplasma capsulatum G186AR]|uniref:Uncharacterized protein n=1 Tax=Ajellomyces capsulatus (strain G186AR / H82 / ATCC MYA-2454 / RMSCC 2432) TaxID=447093 RepID=C0P0U6_AJECG|nr:uncharacterized protein HCBG_09026 [Histoplasma capsulatum G186AR]EEH02746.1 predicted protein [Histoplasma capsulatum G186AR]
MTSVQGWDAKALLPDSAPQTRKKGARDASQSGPSEHWGIIPRVPGRGHKEILRHPADARCNGYGIHIKTGRVGGYTNSHSRLTAEPLGLRQDVAPLASWPQAPPQLGHQLIGRAEHRRLALTSAEEERELLAGIVQHEAIRMGDSKQFLVCCRRKLTLAHPHPTHLQNIKDSSTQDGGRGWGPPPMLKVGASPVGIPGLLVIMLHFRGGPAVLDKGEYSPLCTAANIIKIHIIKVTTVQNEDNKKQEKTKKTKNPAPTYIHKEH